MLPGRAKPLPGARPVVPKMFSPPHRGAATIQLVFLARIRPTGHPPPVVDELDNDPMDELLRALDASDESAVLAAAEDIHYADLASLYENLDDENATCLLKTIGPSSPPMSSPSCRTPSSRMRSTTSNPPNSGFC
jgi:hypothetical protein